MRIKIVLLLLLLAVSFAGSANDDNAPLFNVWLDDSCYWQESDGLGLLGDIHFLWIANGTWQVNCRHGEIIVGEAPEKAKVLISSEENPTGLCCIPAFGICTANVHSVVTPAGKASLSCHGYVGFPE